MPLIHGHARSVTTERRACVARGAQRARQRQDGSEPKMPRAQVALPRSEWWRTRPVPRRTHSRAGGRDCQTTEAWVDFTARLTLARSRRMRRGRMSGRLRYRRSDRTPAMGLWTPLGGLVLLGDDAPVERRL